SWTPRQAGRCPHPRRQIMSAASSCPNCHTVISANLPVGYHGRCRCGVYTYCIVLQNVVPAGCLEWQYRARQQGIPAGGMDAPLLVTEACWTPDAALRTATTDADDTVTDQEAAVLKVLAKHPHCLRTTAQIAEEIRLSEESVND